MKFRVLMGNHAEGGKVYHQGDIVETESDLGLLNHPTGGMKFQRIDGVTSAPVAKDSDTNPPDYSYAERRDAIMAEEASKRENEELAKAEPTRFVQRGANVAAMSAVNRERNQAAAEEASAEDDDDDVPENAALKEMTVVELKELAEKEEADLTGLTLKDEIVSAVKKNRRARAKQA